MNFTEEPEDVCFVIIIAAGKSVSLKQFVSRHINGIGLLVVIAILYLVFSLNALALSH